MRQIDENNSSYFSRINWLSHFIDLDLRTVFISTESISLECLFFRFYWTSRNHYRYMTYVEIYRHFICEYSLYKTKELVQKKKKAVSICYSLNNWIKCYLRKILKKNVSAVLTILNTIMMFFEFEDHRFAVHDQKGKFESILWN